MGAVHSTRKHSDQLAPARANVIRIKVWQLGGQTYYSSASASCYTDARCRPVVTSYVFSA